MCCRLWDGAGLAALSAPLTCLGFFTQLTLRLRSFFCLPTPPSGGPVGYGKWRPAQRLRAYG